MAVKYLAGNRLWGTDAERTAMTVVTETGYNTQCFTDNDDTLDSDHIGYRTHNWRMWGGLKIVDGGALDGESPVGFKFKLKVNGACTGNLVGQIRSGIADGNPGSQGTNQLTSINTIDLSTIQDSTSFQTFNFDGSYELGTNTSEFIGIYWAQAQSNATSSIYIALRWSDETANTSDVISTTNDGAPNNTDFEYWTSKNTNARIITSSSTAYPNLKNGTTFLTSDTNKLWMWDGTDTWNEVS